MMIKVTEEQNYKDYGRVLTLDNGIIKASVTLDVGPRVIAFGFIGSQNIMNDNRAFFGKDSNEKFEAFFGKGKAFENFGGHRIWISPESYPETYYPDCDKVNYTVTKDGAFFEPKPETENGVQKTLELKLSENSADMKVIMRVKNISSEPKEFAIWGLSVSATGGTAIIPMNDNDTGLLSNRIISVWPYTDLSDKRIYYGNKYMTVKQDVNATTPVKLGFDINKGKIHYVLGDEVFTKAYETLHPTAKYPDGGCSFETYTNNGFIELESLGELKSVAAGETSELTENWHLQKKPCDVDTRNDESIKNFCDKL